MRQVFRRPPSRRIGVNELQGAADDRIAEGSQQPLGPRRHSAGMAAQHFHEQQFHHSAKDSLRARRGRLHEREHVADGRGELGADPAVAAVLDSNSGSDRNIGATSTSDDSMKPQTIRVSAPPPP